VYISVIQSQNANVGAKSVQRGSARFPRTGVTASIIHRCSFEFHALSLVLNQILASNPPQARTTPMADLLAFYHGLSASSPRPDVSKMLNAIITGLWLTRCPLFSPTALTAPQHSPSITQPARPSSLPSYQISGPASPAARMAGSIIQVLTPHSYFPTVSHRTLIFQIFISLSRPSRLWVVTHQGRPS
jgi:hypothetical protein